jgi:hypothetical protein
MTASIVRKATVGLAWTWLTLSDHAIIKTKHMLGILFLITTSSLPCLSFAGDYYFWGQQQPPPEYPRFSTGDEVCQSYNGIVAGGLVYAVWIPLYFGSGDPRAGQLGGGRCDLYRVQDGGGLGYFGVKPALPEPSR